jgi:CRISPR-associated endonuclease Csn1
VPLYVADSVKKLADLPNRAVVAFKPEDEWTFMDEEKGYRFLFSLHPNDWVRVQQKGKPMIEGYFGGAHRGTGNINIWTHDRNRTVGKDGAIEGIGIKTALSVQKFHVDLLGRLYPVQAETRQPLSHKRGG